ncbi:MAG: hypothetical protein KKD44_17975 [Proteobacteria bacterium]|nr:hypothetical protein [Pseudomonadota bacterium]
MRNLNILTLLIILFAGSTSVSKENLYDGLKQKERKVILGILVVSLLFLVACAIYGSLRGATSFNVSVITEEVRVKTQHVPMSKWPVHEIQISRTCPDDLDDIRYETFSGTIEIHPDIEIILTRIAGGDLTVKLYDSEGKATATLFDEEEEPVGTLSDCAFFHVTDIEKRAQAGETIVLPVTGDIRVGHEIRFLNSYKTPILYSGNVTILDKTFMFNDYYSVGPFPLEKGDSFTVMDQHVPSQGFISVNNEPAIQLVFRAKGSRGLIKRYQSEGYELHNGIWSKFYHDEALSATWMLVFLMIGMIRSFLVYCGSHK